MTDSSEDKGRIVINNAGQFAGNVGSPGGVVNVGSMAQKLEAAADKVVEQHGDDAEIRSILADADSEVSEKRQRIVKRLQGLAGVGLQVAVLAAEQLLRAHGLLPAGG